MDTAPPLPEDAFLVPGRLPLLADPAPPTMAFDDPAAVASEAMRTVGDRDAAPLPAAGTFLGRFRILSQLGAGGMGVVYHAWDTELTRAVALKVIRTDELDPVAALPRFRREARLAAQLRHPHIVGVHGLGESEGRFWMAMDFVDGTTLAERLGEPALGPGDAAEAADRRLRAAVELIAQTAEAVGHAHAHGIMHRDLKPANILVDREGRARVTDFGLAKEFVASGPSVRLTRSGQAMGTPAYMSPEQATGDAAAMGPRSDVWSLGIMIYEVLTGQLPFVRPEVAQTLQAIVDEELPSPRAVNPRAPADLETVCLRALEKEPARRFAQAGELAAELRRWLRGEAVLTRPSSRCARAARWVARRKRVLAAGVTALALLAALVGWAIRERRASALETFAAEASVAVREFQERLWRTDMPAEARRALAEQPLGLLSRLIEKDPAYGPAWAWRGRVRRALGDDEGAEEDFDGALQRSPRHPMPWAERGLARIRRYAGWRGLPPVDYGPVGLVLLPRRPESAAERALREAGLADLAESDRLGEAEGAAPIAPEERAVARAMAALYDGSADGPARALERLAGTEGPWADSVRATAHYLRLELESAAAIADAILGQWPEHEEARFTRFHARLGIGRERLARGREGALEALADAIDDARRLEKGVSPEPLPELLGARSVAWLSKAEVEEARGVDPRPSLDEAIADLRRVEGMVPGVVEILSNAAVAYRRRGDACAERGEDAKKDLVQAVELLDRVLAIFPGEQAALVNRGVAYLALGRLRLRAGESAEDDFLQARADFAASAEEDPGAVVPRANLAWAWLGIARSRSARGEDPSDALARAIAEAGEATARERTFATGWYVRAEARLDRAAWQRARAQDGRPDEEGAIADLDEALRANPKSAESLDLRGTAWARVGTAAGAEGGEDRAAYERAIADYTAALVLRPGAAGTLSNRADVLRQLAAHDLRRGQVNREAIARAEADATEALRLRPALMEAQVNRGLVRSVAARAAEAAGEEAGAKWRDAMADFDAVLARAPGHRQAREGRAAAWQDLGRGRLARGEDARADFQRALADLDAALAAGRRVDTRTKRASVWFDLAQVENARDGDPLPGLQQALADWDAALAEAPGLPQGRLQRAALLISIGDVEWAFGRDPRASWTRAETDASGAIEEAPGRAKGWWVRAICRLSVAQVDRLAGESGAERRARAEADLRAAGERGAATAREALVELLRGDGRTEEAKAALEAIAREQPARRAWAEGQLREMAEGLPPAVQFWSRRWRAGWAEAAAGKAEAGLALFAEGFAAFERFVAGEFGARCRDALVAEAAEARFAHARALLRARPGDAETRTRALAELERAREWGWRDAERARAEPDLAPLRGDERFGTWLEKVGR